MEPWIAYVKHYLFVISVSMPRMIGIFSVLPFFGKAVSARVRNSIAFSFALLLYPVVEASCPQRPNMLFTLLIVAKEVLIGFIMGYAFSLLFWAVESIGFVIDNQRGANISAVFDPLFGEQTSPFGSFLLQFIAVMFFINGGFLVMLSVVFESYKLWPIFSFFPRFNLEFALSFLQQVDRLMEVMLVLAAPVLIAVFISEFGLGLINRFAPQLNVFFLSMPIKSGIACLILVIYITFMYTYLRPELAGIDKTVAFLRSVLSGG